MIIKQATTPNDFRSSLYVRTNVFINELKCNPKDIYDDIDSISTIFLVLDGINPIGCGRITIKDNLAIITHFCITKEKRLKKYGTLLFQSMEKFISNSNATTILLNPMNDNLIFFEKIGFSFDFNDDKLGMMMKKKIK